MKKSICIIALILAACANPFAQQPSVPNMPPAATAYIDPSYPTAQAQQVSTAQAVSGINVNMERVWRDGKNINADVCFTLPDASDWAIWSSSLTYNGGMLDVGGTTLLRLQEPANGQPGVRCDTLTFVAPPDIDLSSAVITIDSIGATPRSDEYCSMYMPKIQQALNDRGVAITLECVDENGAMTMRIASKPADMPQEQAEEIVFSDEFYTIKGPWVFNFDLGQ